MATTRTIEVFSLSELKDAHPEAYAKVHERWANLVGRDSCPWSDETMDMETLRAMMTNLRECSEGANDPPAPSTDAERYERGEFDVDCEGGCGWKVRPDSDGVCYQCQCEMHAAGTFDMDAEEVWERGSSNPYGIGGCGPEGGE